MEKDGKNDEDFRYYIKTIFEQLRYHLKFYSRINCSTLTSLFLRFLVYLAENSGNE